MKTSIKFLVVAVAAAMLLSCAKEIPAGISSEIQTKEYTFKAGVDLTKTALDGLSVNWTSSDVVKVYYKYLEGDDTSKGAADASISETDGTTATFVVSLPETVVLDTLYAVYKPYAGNPFDGWWTTSGVTRGRVEFKTTQTAVKDGFDSNATPMIARWINSGDDTPAFTFSNLSGLLKLEVDNQSSRTLDYIVFENSKEIIGAYYWGYKPGTNDILKSLSTKNKSVKLDGPFTGKGTYYIALPSSSTEYSDMTLSFYSEGKVKTLSNPNTLTVARNTVYPFGSFTVTDDWFPTDDSFKVTCLTKSRADRDTTYTVTVAARDGIAWTASVLGEDATLTPSSGTGSGTITVKVPTNYSTTADKNYTVTVSTEDTSIDEADRSQNVILTQAHETKVLFGTQWGYSFIKGWNGSFAKSIEYTAEYVTAKTDNQIGQSTSSTAAYIRGNYSFSFIAGETGKGSLSFRARVYGNKKTLVVKKGDTTVLSFKSPDLTPATSDVTDIFTATFDVEKDDVITISISGSSSHYLYCNNTSSISWMKAKAE